MFSLKCVMACISLCWLLTANAQTIRGEIKDAFSGVPLVGATVTVVNQNIGTVTDSAGRFRVELARAGIYQLDVRYLGYQSLIVSEVVIGKGREHTLELGLPPVAQELSPAIVRAKRTQVRVASVPASTITVDATERMPATFFDPARMATYLPGTAQQNDQANGISVRGNSPVQTAWRLNGLDIVNPSHLTNAGTFSDRPIGYGGGANALSAQLMDHTRYYRGNQPYNIGNASAGLLAVELRRGHTERQQYALQAGLIGLDATVESPLAANSNASGVINARYSFTGLLADLGVDFGGEEISFKDVNANLTFPLGKNGSVDVFGLAGISRNHFTPSEDEEDWEDEKSLYRSIEYDGELVVIGSRMQLPITDRSYLRGVMGYSVTQAKREANSDFAIIQPHRDKEDRHESKLSTQFSFHQRFGTGIWFAVGSEVTAYKSVWFRRFLDDNTLSRFRGEFRGTLFQPFVNWQHQIGAFRYQLGLHTYQWKYSFGFNLEPRLMASYLTKNIGTFTVAYGHYSQMPSSRLFFPEQLPEARHVDVSWEKNLGDRAQLTLSLFRQQHRYLLVNAFLDDYNSFNILDDSSPDQVRNTGEAQTQGIEIGLEKFAGSGWNLLANATLFSSRYRGSDMVWRDSRFARDYLANMIVGKEWNSQRANDRSRRVGVQVGVHLSGGAPVRPLNVGASQFSRESVYIQGEGYSDRLAPYFRTDLRVYLMQDRKKRTSILSLDIQNVSNTQNEAYEYYDRLLEAPTVKYQLGIIPVLNWRMEFKG